jgi:hypothetical protein
MPVTINGSNTPTAGGVTYGDGTTYATTAAGTSGQVLTSAGSSAPTWSTISSVGSGGTTASGNVTLTSASPAQQSVTPTTYGQSVTLPNATTCTKGVTTFGIYNQGPYPLLIKDNAGTLLGFARVASQVSCALADSSTSAGVWNLSGAIPCDIDAQLNNNNGFTTDASYVFAIQVTSTKDLVVIAGSDASAVLYDSSTQTWGSPVTLPVGNIGFTSAAYVISSTSVLYACAGSTNWAAMILSISGTTLTVNTAASATLAGAITNLPMTIIPVGSSYVCSYNRATSVTAIRAMTVSGTTVTVSAETLLSGTNSSYKPVMYAYSTSNLITFSCTASYGTYADSWGISGTTITPISSSNLMTGLGNGFQADVFSSGRWSIIQADGSNMLGYVVTSAGSITATTISSASNQWNPANISTLVVGNSVLFASCGTANNVNAVNVLTDSSGTAVAGTAITNKNSVGGLTPFRLMGKTASALYIGVWSLTAYFDAYKITISGGSPVMTFLNRFVFTSASNIPSATLFVAQVSNSSNVVPGAATTYPTPLLVGSKFGNGVFAASASYANQALTFLNEGLYLAPIPVSGLTNTANASNTARASADTAYTITRDNAYGPTIQRLRIA